MGRFMIYERSRCQSAQRAIERGIGREMSGTLYDAVKECIVSEVYYDIPEVIVTDEGEIIQPMYPGPHSWQYCTNEMSFENGWIPGGYGGMFRQLDESTYQFVTAIRGLIVVREYVQGCLLGEYEQEEFISKEQLLASDDPPERWMVGALLGE